MNDLVPSADDRSHLARIYRAVEPRLAEVVAAVAEATRLPPDEVRDWLCSGMCGPWDEGFVASRREFAARFAHIGWPSSRLPMVIRSVRAAYRDALGCEEPALYRLLDLELALLLSAGDRRQREMLEGISAGFAHELRNPINSAVLQLEVLERRIRRAGSDGGIEGIVRGILEPLERAREELARIDSLTDDFLVIAQPAALEPSRESIGRVVLEVVARERPRADAAGVDLIALGATEPVVASIDRAKLVRAIACLVRNAIEAVPAGGRVVVRLLADAADVHVLVEDDGPGIPDSIRARLFEPFVTTKPAGTGLGLSIVRSIVVQHGGTITATSSSDGARFDLAIPRARELQDIEP